MSTASVGYLKPAVGVLVGCALMGEPFTWTIAVGLGAILLGVAAIHPNRNHSSGNRPASTAEAAALASTRAGFASATKRAPSA